MENNRLVELRKYAMRDLCATCGERFGMHIGLSCMTMRGSFVLAAPSTAMKAPYFTEPEAEPAPVTPLAKYIATRNAEYTYERAKDALLVVVGRHGRDFALDILKVFNATKISDVRESDYRSLIECCNLATDPNAQMKRRDERPLTEREFAWRWEQGERNRAAPVAAAKPTPAGLTKLATYSHQLGTASFTAVAPDAQAAEARPAVAKAC